MTKWQFVFLFPIVSNISFHLSALSLPGEAGPLRRNAGGWASEAQHGPVCWKLVSKCLLFCMRLYSCFMLYRICSKRKKAKIWQDKHFQVKK